MQTSIQCFVCFRVCTVCFYFFLSQAISRAKAHRMQRGEAMDPDVLDEIVDVNMDSDEDSVSFPAPARGRGRGRGGRGRGGRGRGKGEVSYYISQT